MAIFMPQAKQKNDIGELMSAGQLAMGVATGNPAMAFSGASGLSSSDSQPQQVANVESDAMSRRMNQLQQEDPVMSLAQAKEALAYQPPEIQKEYGSTIEQALKLAKQSRQSAGMA